MTPDPSAPRRGAADALAEIQKAEAERMLGLPFSTDLTQSAQQWVADGISTSNSRALAGAGEEVPDGVRSALLQQLAAEVGANFASTSEARTFEANGIILTMSQGGEFGSELYGLSNGLTDEFTARFRRFFARLLRRDS